MRRVPQTSTVGAAMCIKKRGWSADRGCHTVGRVSQFSLPCLGHLDDWCLHPTETLTCRIVGFASHLKLNLLNCWSLDKETSMGVHIAKPKTINTYSSTANKYVVAPMPSRSERLNTNNINRNARNVAPVYTTILLMMLRDDVQSAFSCKGVNPVQ